jgi:hypothetical protein
MSSSCILSSASATLKMILGPSLKSESSTRAAVSLGIEVVNRHRYLQGARGGACGMRGGAGPAASAAQRPLQQQQLADWRCSATG